MDERGRTKEKETREKKLYLMYWMYPCLASSRRNPGFRISTLSNTIESTHATIVKPLIRAVRLDHSTNLDTALRFTPRHAASSFTSDASRNSILHHCRKSRAMRARELFTKNPLFRVHRSVKKSDAETLGNSTKCAEPSDRDIQNIR